MTDDEIRAAIQQAVDNLAVATQDVAQRAIDAVLDAVLDAVWAELNLRTEAILDAVRAAKINLPVAPLPWPTLKRMVRDDAGNIVAVHEEPAATEWSATLEPEAL